MSSSKDVQFTQDAGGIIRAATDGMFWPTLLGIAGVIAGFSGRWHSIPVTFDWPLATALWGVGIVTAAPVIFAIYVANRQITIVDTLAERHGGPDSITIRPPDGSQAAPKKVNLWEDVNV